MKLESLKETKFKDTVLKREQMFTLNGGGTETPAGSGCGDNVSASNPTVVYNFDYGYDAIRTNPDGSKFTTYHNRTNVSIISRENCIGL